jgi:hypothetical protein
MNKIEFLQNREVSKFVQWLIQKANGTEGLQHSYVNQRTGTQWNCSSIFNAYEGYRWPFSTSFSDGTIIQGESYSESETLLNTLAKQLRDALNNNDEKVLKEVSITILGWGKVINRNRDKVRDIPNYANYLSQVKKQLNPENVNLNDSFISIHMNSGFTKIYSLLMDSFIIYDSRVGAALGYLVRIFMESNISSLGNSVPEQLRFAYGMPRNTNINRNPSSNEMRFPVLRGDSKFHTKNNIRANWILQEVANNSIFNQCASPLRALEAALFMIGYHIPRALN